MNIERIRFLFLLPSHPTIFLETRNWEDKELRRRRRRWGKVFGVYTSRGGGGRRRGGSESDSSCVLGEGRMDGRDWVRRIVG